MFGLLATTTAAALTAKSGNMNGKYAVSSKGDISVPWNDDYASKGYEYFDVWAPEIATHYGEVFWTDQGSNPLPPDVIKRFDGKVIAIQGYEQDQVMVTPTGSPGANPEKDVSVPINWAYNHHYCAWMTGKHVEMKSRPTSLMFDGDAYASGAHGQQTMMVPVEKSDAPPREFEDVAQTSWFISEGNGGESRKSFHGYPQGYAQLLESPTSWHITPMQIDTRNREHGVGPESVGNCTNMTECAGYEPRQARYGRNWGGLTQKNKKPDGYSGILECPCNGRYGGDPMFTPKSKTKVLSRSFTAIPSGACKQSQVFPSPQKCFDAVAQLGFNATAITNKSAADATLPSGCVLVKNADGTAEALFNTRRNVTGGCASSATTSAESSSPATKVTVKIALAHENPKQNGSATITISGPAAGWFAVGLDAKLMHDNPYTVVVNDQGVTERKLGTCGTEADHCGGTLLNSSVTVISSEVVNGVRTVVLTRPFVGATKDHYTFDPTKVATLNYISAAGSSQAFAYHKVHDTLVMSFTAAAGPTCVCDLGETGSLCETNGTACHSFVKGCVSRSTTLGHKGEASGDLLADRNPTCNSGSYVGGLSCCSHKRIMLDDDQVVPPELLKYHMKFRFWYQEYKPEVPKVSNASHVDLARIYFTTEANAGEYDIPPAFYTGDEPKIAGYPLIGPYPELTPGSSCTGNCPGGDDCECEHTISYNHTVSNMRLIYASGHCHAPACIGIWLYRNDPGHEMELLCHQAPIYGNGTGHNSESGIYDEAGYLALPPCLFADEPGLHPSVLLPPNTELVSIKKNRNTRMGHYGEMASWQCRGLSN